MIAAPFALIRSPGHIYVLITNVNSKYVLVKIYSIQGRPQDLGGGGPRNFFVQIWEFACREATCCAWRSHAHC